MKLRIAGFTGMVPRTNPRLLANEAAQRAVNCRLEAGDLVPLCLPSLNFTLGGAAASIFMRNDGSWLSWATTVNAANGPVSTDRTYYTGDGAPKVKDAGGTVYPLALAKPAAPLVITALPGTPAVAASGTITFSGTGPAAGQIITIGSVPYKFVAALSVGPTVANEIVRNNTPSIVAASLRDALNGVTGPTVSVGTVANTKVSGAAVGAVVTVTADIPGALGNAIIFANTTPASNTAFAPAGGLMSGGADGIAIYDEDTSEAVFYSYTYVTSLGEESQPAALSNQVVCSALQVISLTGFAAAPGGRGITSIRIYRSQTDTLGATQLFFVAEVLLAGLVPPYLHNPATTPIGSLCPSINFDPPVATLAGLCAGPGGMMAAFSGKDLYFCEPYQPHAWPAIYSATMDYDIVGLASIGSAFVVMTTGTPYLMQGTHPSSMAQTKLEQNLPCVAPKGIVDLGSSVIYPSTEGFVSVSNAGAQMISGQLYSRQDWQALVPSTIVASQHIGRYVFSYLPAGAGTRSCSILDTTGAAPWLVDSDEPFTATFFQLGTGRMFFLKNGTQIYEWDVLTNAAKTMIWRSKLFHMAAPVNFGAFLMETDNYAGTGTGSVRIYADGVLKNTITARNAASRLKSGFLALRWEIEFEGTIPITTLNIAHTITELASQ